MLNGSGLKSVRAVGKLDNLKHKLNGDGVGATIGIGHTRWATHGRVTEQNAHPLTAGDHEELAIVLNGIIENHAELRKALLADGERFTSDTDAEVVAHLVRREYRGCLIEAVRRAYRRLEGHFAFIAVHRDHSDLLVGARRQCPLIVGMGEGETFLASSITAFSSDTRRIKLVEDGEIVAITAERVQLDDSRRRGADAGSNRGAGGLRDAGEERLRDVHAQGDLRAAATRSATRSRAISSGGACTSAPSRALSCSGSSAWRSSRAGPRITPGSSRATRSRRGPESRASLEIASEWRYRDPLIDDGTLVIGISQSGETADTLAGLRLARERGARTLAITNSPGSQITREVDAVLYTHAGIEIGVAATKTFTSQVALLYLLALRLAELRGTLPPAELDDLMAEVRALPHRLESCLQAETEVRAVAERHHDKPFFLYLGRHVGLPVCLEGALKLKEIAYIPTEAYAAGEMKHGPIALLDEQTPVVCVATRSHVNAKLVSNLEEVRARGAHVIAVATDGDDTIAEVADDVLYVPATHPLLQPIVAIVPLQFLAYHTARLRGLDVDQPRNLAKTVTVE